jgi:hypothetical protein
MTLKLTVFDKRIQCSIKSKVKEYYLKLFFDKLTYFSLTRLSLKL